jgi:hypothetical protein
MGRPRRDLQHFCNCESFSKIGARIERVKEEGTELARAFAEPQEKAASKYMMRSIQIIEGPHQDGWEAKAEAESTIRGALAPQ